MKGVRVTHIYNKALQKINCHATFINHLLCHFSYLFNQVSQNPRNFKTNCQQLIVLI